MTNLKQIEAAMAADMEAQARFLLTEAMWRGFDSVEELFHKEPSTFDHLALLWRETEGLIWDGEIEA